MPTGDHTEIFDLTKLKAAVAAKAEVEKRAACLIFLAGPQAGRVVKINAPGLVLGRAEGVDLQVQDTGISRRHCQLTLGDGMQVTVTDLYSTNGTFINGQRVTRCPMREGDKLQLGGEAVLTLRYQDALDEDFQRRQYELATRDSMTGCYNKNYLMERLPNDLTLCRRHGQRLCLAIFDLDHFKRVNDTFGHLAGDRVLAAAAGHIRAMLRKTDLVARFGGEEFVVLLRETSLADAVILLDRIRTKIGQSPVTCEGHTIEVTISVGVAALEQDTADAGGLLQAADSCLYRAKQSGRNRVCGTL